MTIRAIHPFGPPVGAYVPAVATDIRIAFERERARLAAAQPAVEYIVTAPPPADDLPRTNAFLGMGEGGGLAVFA